MAVTVEGTPTTSGAVASAASITFAHTTGASALGLFVGTGAQTVSSTVDTVTFNSDALTELWEQDDTANIQVSAGYLMVTPDIGSFNVVVTYSANVDLGAAGAVGLAGLQNSSVANAHRTVYTNNDTGGGAPTVTVVDSQTDDLVIDCAVTFNSTIAVDAGQTSRCEDDAIAGGGTSFGISTEVATGASTVMSWTGGLIWATGATALIAGPPPSSITFVNSTAATIGTAATTWSIAPHSSIVGGAGLIVGVGVGTSAVTVSTMTDNTTNVYLKAIARASPLPAAGAELWYTRNISSASTRISVTLSGSASGSIAVGQWTHLSTGSPLDTVASSGNSTLSTVHSITQLTPSTKNCLIVTFNRATQSTISPTAHDGGLTAWVTTGQAVRTIGAYIIQGAASTCTGQWRTNAGSCGGCLFSGVQASFFDTFVVAAGGAFYYDGGAFCMLGVQH